MIKHSFMALGALTLAAGSLALTQQIGRAHV